MKFFLLAIFSLSHSSAGGRGSRLHLLCSRRARMLWCFGAWVRAKFVDGNVGFARVLQRAKAVGHGAMRDGAALGAAVRDSD